MNNLPEIITDKKDDDGAKERLRQKITELQEQIDASIEKLEESYKDKNKTKAPIEEETPEDIVTQKPDPKKKKKKKEKFLKIFIDKGKEFFVAKNKWKSIISALKKLFISNDDKEVELDELKLNNAQIKLLLGKLKNEKLLKQLRISLLLKQIIGTKSLSMVELQALQNALIKELKNVLSSEKIDLLAIKTAQNLQNSSQKDAILKPELQTEKFKVILEDQALNFKSSTEKQKTLDSDSAQSLRFDNRINDATARFEQLSMMRQKNTNSIANSTAFYSITSIAINVVMGSIKQLASDVVAQIKDFFKGIGNEEFKQNNRPKQENKFLQSNYDVKYKAENTPRTDITSATYVCISIESRTLI